MKLEQKVISLKYAKELKKLGFEKPSEFYWDNHTEFGQGFILTQEPEMEEFYPAYLPCELGEWLPDKYQLLKVGSPANKWIGYKVHYGKFGNFGNTDKICEIITKSGIEEEQEANARAKLLIYLLKNNLLKP